MIAPTRHDGASRGALPLRAARDNATPWHAMRSATFRRASVTSHARAVHVHVRSKRLTVSGLRRTPCAVPSLSRLNSRSGAALLRRNRPLFAPTSRRTLTVHATSDTSPALSTGQQWRFPMSDLFISKEELQKFAEQDLNVLEPGTKPPWVQDSQVAIQPPPHSYPKARRADLLATAGRVALVRQGGRPRLRAQRAQDALGLRPLGGRGGGRRVAAHHE
eukprot:scaffold2926_cov399-Prasinococcus_capsulatus_cf.AAC.21